MIAPPGTTGLGDGVSTGEGGGGPGSGVGSAGDDISLPATGASALLPLLGLAMAAGGIRLRRRLG